MKRKITKKSLDELRQIMPIIPEYDQSSMIGGVEFRDMTGNYLGKIGISDEVRFIDRDKFDSLSSTMNDYDAEKSGTSWTRLSADGKYQIVNNIVQGNSKYSKLQKTTIAVDLRENRVMGVDQTISAGYPSTPFLHISMHGDIYTFSEIESILVHENVHANTYTISGITGFINKDEDSAYSGQVSDPSFLRTHYWFRVQVANNWFNAVDRKWYRKIGIANACGVSLHDIQ